MMNSRQMNSAASKYNPFAERCLYCGQQAGIVWVHGHGQCAACGTNVDECCRGESYDGVQPESKTDNHSGNS